MEISIFVAKKNLSGSSKLTYILVGEGNDHRTAESSIRLPEGLFETNDPPFEPTQLSLSSIDPDSIDWTRHIHAEGNLGEFELWLSGMHPSFQLFEVHEFKQGYVFVALLPPSSNEIGGVEKRAFMNNRLLGQLSDSGSITTAEEVDAKEERIPVWRINGSRISGLYFVEPKPIP